MEFEIYNYMFNYLKNHEWDNFISKLETFDSDFDVNTRDNDNNYFITYAIIFNQPKIVKLLLDREAKMDMIDQEGFSILYIPIKFKYNKILDVLLEADKKNIGISIVDIKDKTDKIALHYAIIMKNIYAVDTLLTYNSNPNIKEIAFGYNALHLAIRSRSFEICELVVKYIDDINSKCNTGETALHIACNFKLTEIVKLLIKYKINVNIQDYNNEITALHYCVHLNDKALIDILLKNNADTNLQDAFGNTPIHYAISENNFEIFIELYNSSNSVNLNLWNLEGEIPLHIILKSEINNMSDYLDIMIDKSNLSLQDISGNTCLHYLIMLNLWKEYSTYLVKKRLDIITKNKEGRSVMDLLDKKEYDIFLDIVEESYYHRLYKSGIEWQNEWENICSAEFEEIDKKALSKLGKDITEKNIKSKCKNIIRDKLIKLINDNKNNKTLDCSDKSFPMKKIKQCINVNEGTNLDLCSFTGNTLDVLIGLIYLLEKHKNSSSTLSSNFTDNKELCKFYRNLGIIMNNKCEFLNFEIIWIMQKLYLSEDFYDNFKNCLKKNIRFIIIPLGISNRDSAHANYLIYDHQNKEVERFEPHGSSAPRGMNYNPSLLDEILKNKFKTIDQNIKYIRPIDYLPKIGFQSLDVYETGNKKIGDPLGFCALWCIWYADMRLTYSDFTRNNLVKILIDNLRKSNISFRNMIRNYAQNIIKLRDALLNKSDMDINDWQNDQYTDVQINSIMSELVNKIKKIS